MKKLQLGMFIYDETDIPPYIKKLYNELTQKARKQILKPRCNIDAMIKEARIAFDKALGIPVDLTLPQKVEQYENLSEEIEKEFKNQDMRHLTVDMRIDESGIKDMKIEEKPCKMQ